MQHDKKWLKDNNGFNPESGVNEASDWNEFACDYHEHMDRWRIVADGDLPEVGQHAVCETNDGFHEVWSWRAKYAAEVKRWKPINI